MGTRRYVASALSITRNAHGVVGLLMALTACTKALSAQDAERVRLEAMRVRRPHDAVVLFNLAALHASSGRMNQALQLLDTVSRAPGALDPSYARAFYPLHGDTAWQRIINRIRSANAPVVRSSTAFVLGERDLQPEGIAFDPVSRALFVGSYKGRIVRIDSAGHSSDFARVSSPDRQRMVLGLHVDVVRRHLWAVVDDPRSFADTTIRGGSLVQIDIPTGQVVAVHGSATGALNDVVVAPDGDAFTTNTTDGSIWRVPLRGTLERFLPPGSVVEANGITISPDGKWLFIAGWHDITRIDIRSRTSFNLTAPDGVVVGSFDGLYWHDGGLIGIQNGIHPGRVVRLRLNRERTRITKVDLLEQYHPESAGMTTAAIDGHSLLYFLNTQSRSFNGDGTVKPGVTLRDIIIARLPCVSMVCPTPRQ